MDGYMDKHCKCQITNFIRSQFVIKAHVEFYVDVFHIK